MTLKLLVEALPEAYQPIYGNPEFDTQASRPCQDRLQLISLIHDQLTIQLGRPLKVLDLGCAQGYFSLHLAERGATVIGIDRLKANIELCQHLAAAHTGLSVQFRVGSVEDTLERLEPHGADLVLGLSVLHHLCAEKGADTTRSMLKALSNKIKIGLFEVAVKEEPVTWASAQPETPDWLYQDFAFLACVGEFNTHLSEHKRPLYFASNTCWFACNTITHFHHWTPLAHELDRLGHDRGRRYFESNSQLMKLFRFHGKHGEWNRKELEREIAFLSRADIAGLGYPKILDYKLGKIEGWVLRERIPGQLLSTALLGDKPPDPGTVVQALLPQLCELELRNLFHEDLRVWNVLISTDGRIILIDYGSITSERTDREYPQDWRIPLLILLHRLYHPSNPLVWPPRLDELQPAKLPEPAARVVRKLWNTPADAWNWTKFAQEWAQNDVAPPPTSSRSLKENLHSALIESTTQEIQLIKTRLSDLETEVTATRNRLRKWDQRLAVLKPAFRFLNTVFRSRIRTQPALSIDDGPLQAVLCPVCKQGTGQVYIGPDAFSHPVYRLLQCNACCSIFSNPMPSDSQLAELYKNAFDYRWYRDHYDAKLKDCRQRVEEYRPLLGKRILDFGGGMGYLSTALKETGFDSLTYDPYVPGQSPGKNEWDTVIALHVLEHSNNLERTLSEIKSLLAPGGRIILAVPNRAGEGYRTMGMNWVWAQPPLVHIFHFTAQGLKTLLERHGFMDIEIRYQDRWDANRFCDIEQAAVFRQKDALWSLQPFNRIATYRRWIARRNARLRFAGLTVALTNQPPNDDTLAELQVSAVLHS